MADYSPISCHNHDELEAMATKKQLCHIHFADEDDRPSCIVDHIKDFPTRGNIEYVLMAAGQWIRLDRIRYAEALFWRDN